MSMEGTNLKPKATGGIFTELPHSNETDSSEDKLHVRVTTRVSLGSRRDRTCGVLTPVGLGKSQNSEWC